MYQVLCKVTGKPVSIIGKEELYVHRSWCQKKEALLFLSQLSSVPHVRSSSAALSLDEMKEGVSGE